MSPGPGRPGSGARRPLRRAAAIATGALALAAVTTAVMAARGSPPARDGRERAVSVTARAAGTVEFQGVPGQVTIVGAATGQVRLTGQLDWSGRAPLVAVRTRGAGSARVLRLVYWCAARSPCTGNYRLVVPSRTALVVRQPSGHVVLSGLAGPLRITAGSADVSATGLRGPSLAATITSGHLAAVFDAPPRQVTVTLRSAQATLWLPASAAYAVSQQVTAGYLRVAVPRASDSPRTVAARVTSGELELRAGRPAAGVTG